MLALGGAALLGWALGANDAGNVFGTAVASRAVRYRTAVVICAACVVLGAVLEGSRGIETLGKLAQPDATAAVVASVSAGLVVAITVGVGLPVSTSQAVIGAIIGIGLTVGTPRWDGLPKILLCWVATPVAAAVVALVLHACGGAILNRLRMSMLTRDNVLWGLLLVFGAYGAYALGANNVANITGVYSRAGIVDSPTALAAIGGAFMALGVVTFSRRNMMTVGSRLMRLDAYAALVVVAAEAVTVHAFAWIGVPVSTSQAVIGGVIGVGLMRGAGAIHVSVLKTIGWAWFLSPVLAAMIASAIYRLVA